MGYAFDLPIEPNGTLLDVDNDGEEDTGVQIFSAMVGANINPGSHLEQLDQAGDLSSYLTDPATGEITEGGLLIYAPDDKQGFPSGFGDDGLLFTADDPAVALPQGYTVVHFGPDGFTFDRSTDAELNLLQDPESDSPDFSKQGIVESYNSLIDHLAKRYSFTDLRKLDWEAIRAEFLPEVKQAEQVAASDPVTGGAIYAFVLHEVAQKVKDAHVMAVIGDVAFAAEVSPLQALLESADRNQRRGQYGGDERRPHHRDRRHHRQPGRRGRLDIGHRDRRRRRHPRGRPHPHGVLQRDRGHGRSPAPVPGEQPAEVPRPRGRALRLPR